MRAILALATALLVIFAARSALAEMEGVVLLQSKGCFTCHSTDGSTKSGPTFKQLWGRRRAVTTNGDPHQITVDEEYLRRSIRDPDADVVVGYAPHSMPKLVLSDAEMSAVIAVLRNPEAVTESQTRRGGSILPLASACVAFVLLHFLFSAIPVRKRIVSAAGDKGFLGFYSIWALLTFAAMVIFYRSAPFIELWSPPRWTRWIPVLVMPIALFLLVCGFSTPSPTAVAQGELVTKNPEGIVTVTRHPALWGFALWACAHLATTGELRVILVAGAILVLAIGGMLHIDARRKATLGPAWDAFAAKTSLVPFGAIAEGRARLVPAEIGLRRVAIAAFVYLLLFFAHPIVIGASPSP